MSQIVRSLRSAGRHTPMVTWSGQPSLTRWELSIVAVVLTVLAGSAMVASVQQGADWRAPILSGSASLAAVAWAALLHHRHREWKLQQHNDYQRTNHRYKQLRDESRHLREQNQLLHERIANLESMVAGCPVSKRHLRPVQ